MKGKRHTTEERIRILREADSGKNIIEVCRNQNISEVTFVGRQSETSLTTF